MARSLITPALIAAVLALLFFQQPITPIMIASMILILIGLRMMLAEKADTKAGEE